MFAAVELEERRRSFAVEPDEAVGIVFEHEQVMLACEVDEPAAALARERSAARILERRDRVEERRLVAACECLLEALELKPLLVHRHGHDLHSRGSEDLQR